MNRKNDKIEEFRIDSDGDFGINSDSDLDFDAEFDYLLCSVFQA